MAPLNLGFLWILSQLVYSFGDYLYVSTTDETKSFFTMYDLSTGLVENLTVSQSNTTNNISLLECHPYYATKSLYCFEEREKKIVRFHLEDNDGGISENVYEGLTSSNTQIAIDNQRGNIYFTDGHLNWLIMTGISGKTSSIPLVDVINNNVKDVIDIVCDELNRKLFWISNSGSPVIWQSSLDGKNVVAVLFSDLMNPSFLILYKNNLLWLDKTRRTIEMSSIDAKNQSIIAFADFNDVKQISSDGESLIASNTTDIFKLNLGETVVTVKHMLEERKGTISSISIYRHNSKTLSDECKQLDCDHFCMADNTETKCICKEGYVLFDGSCFGSDDNVKMSMYLVINNTLCTTNTTILASISHDIQCYSGVNDVRHITLDSNERVLYYYQHNDSAVYGSIFSFRLKNQKSTFLTTTSKISSGLALDWTTGHLYWVSNENLIMYSTKENTQTVLLGNVGQVTSLQVDALARKLIWSSKTDQTIESADLDGSNRKFIIYALKPKSIAYDIFRKRIYWVTDCGIMSIGLDGDRLSILTSLDEYPEHLYLYKEILYWFQFSTKDNFTYLRTQTIDGKMDGKSTGYVFKGPVSDVAVFDIENENISDACIDSKSNCEQSCLSIRSNDDDVECGCKFGFVLDENRYSCNADFQKGNFILLLDQTRKTIFQMDMSNTFVTRVSTEANPIDMTMLSNSSVLYFTEDGNTIKQVNLRNKTVMKTTINDIQPEVLGVTSSGNLIFSGLRSDGLTNMYMYSYMNESPSTILENVGQVKDISIHHESWSFYFSGKNKDYYIRRISQLDHKDLQFSSPYLQQPTGLSVDNFDNSLYWVDGELMSVFRSNLDGGSKTNIYHERDFTLLDIDVDEIYLYITTLETKSILQMKKNGLTNVVHIRVPARLGIIGSMIVYSGNFFATCEKTFSNIEVSSVCNLREGSKCNWTCIEEGEDKLYDLPIICAPNGSWQLEDLREVKCVSRNQLTEMTPVKSDQNRGCGTEIGISIMLSILGAVIVMGVIYYVYKRRQAKKDSDSIELSPRPSYNRNNHNRTPLPPIPISPVKLMRVSSKRRDQELYDSIGSDYGHVPQTQREIISDSAFEDTQNEYHKECNSISDEEDEYDIHVPYNAQSVSSKDEIYSPGSTTYETNE